MRKRDMGAEITVIKVKGITESCSTCALYEGECAGNWFGWCNRYRRREGGEQG